MQPLLRVKLSSFRGTGSLGSRDATINWPLCFACGSFVFYFRASSAVDGAVAGRDRTSEVGKLLIEGRKPRDDRIRSWGSDVRDPAGRSAFKAPTDKIQWGQARTPYARSIAAGTRGWFKRNRWGLSAPSLQRIRILQCLKLTVSPFLPNVSRTSASCPDSRRHKTQRPDG